MIMTDHAQQRSRQRAIPAGVLELLLAFGTREHAGGRCWRHGFSRRSLEQVMRYSGAADARLVSEYRHAYAIVSFDGAVVTVGYRKR